MQIINQPKKETWSALCERNVPDDEKVIESVRHIVAAVRQEGDAALRRYAHEFDHTEITDIELSSEERTALAAQTAPQVAEAIKKCLAQHQVFSSSPTAP